MHVFSSEGVKCESLLGVRGNYIFVNGANCLCPNLTKATLLNTGFQGNQTLESFAWKSFCSSFNVGIFYKYIY